MRRANPKNPWAPCFGFIPCAVESDTRELCPQLYRTERLARTEKGATRRALKVAPVGDQIVSHVGRAHVTFKYGVVVGP